MIVNKFVYLFFCVWGLLVILFFFTTARNESDTPQILLSEKERNFGLVFEGKILHHVFNIKNIGNKTLRVDARSSCGCTKAELSMELIPPGKTGTISVWLDTEGRSHNFEQFVYLSTNDPFNKTIQLKLYANVEREVEIFPNQLWLGEVPKNYDVLRKVVISRKNNESFNITRIEIPDGVQYKLGEKIIKDGITQIPVELYIITSDTLGYFHRVVTVHTEHSTIEEHEIEISAQVLTDLKVIPPRVDLKEVTLGTEVRKDIKLIPIKKTIENITAQSANNNISIENYKKEDEYFILSFKAQIPEYHTSIQDTIKVYCDDSNDTDIIIPVQLNTVEAVSMNSL